MTTYREYENELTADEKAIVRAATRIKDITRGLPFLSDYSAGLLRALIIIREETALGALEPSGNYFGFERLP